VRSIKVIHVPYTKRNPYQKLLSDSLKAHGLDVKVEQMQYLWHRSLFNITIVAILINHWKPDIIHFHWQHGFLVDKKSQLKTFFKSLLFISQLLLLKLLKVKIVWTVHNLEKHEKVHEDLQKQFTRIFERLCDLIIAHCETAMQEIIRVFRVKRSNKVCLIPHGNYLDFYPNIMSQEFAKAQLGLSPSDVTFLFFGEIRYYKGVLELIDSFKSLSKEDIRLIIAGKPKGEKITQEVISKIKNNKNIYTILKFIPDNDLQTLMNGSDILVFPYRDIFTSGGILLGMSFAKPIIAPKLGCIKDTLDEAGAFLYDSNDINGLTNAMRNAIDSRNKLQAMGQYNLELAKKYDWNNIGRMTCMTYLEVLK